MEYVGLFIFFGLSCFLCYFAIKDEHKKNSAIIARENAQAKLIETIVASINHNHICIYCDALRDADDDLEVIDNE